jgi:hypothetical protein
MDLEPVADVISVAVNERDSDRVVQKVLEVLQEVGIDKISGLLEGEIDPAQQLASVNIPGGIILLIIRVIRVVTGHSKGFLDRSLVEIWYEVVRRRRIIGWMSDIINATFSEDVIRPFDVVTAHACCLRADRLAIEGGVISCVAEIYLVEASIWHVASELIRLGWSV